MHGESYHIYTTQQKIVGIYQKRKHNCEQLPTQRKYKPNAYTFDCVIFYRSQTPVVPM